MGIWRGHRFQAGHPVVLAQSSGARGRDGSRTGGPATACPELGGRVWCLRRWQTRALLGPNHALLSVPIRNHGPGRRCGRLRVVTDIDGSSVQASAGANRGLDLQNATRCSLRTGLISSDAHLTRVAVYRILIIAMPSYGVGVRFLGEVWVNERGSRLLRPLTPSSLWLRSPRPLAGERVTGVPVRD